jgi:hypothetical protein
MDSDRWPLLAGEHNADATDSHSRFETLGYERVV